jgi:RNA polymerase sigma factor (sigma-70 family)
MAQSDDREAEPQVFNEPSERDDETTPLSPALSDRAGPANGEREKAAAVDSGSARLLNVEAVDDHQLLNDYVEGDEQAFETLVEKYFRMVYTVAGRQTGDWHLAEEIAQSVFLILSRKARGFSSKTPVPGWLLRTTRFVSSGAIRMRRRREQKERKFAVDSQEPFEMNPVPSDMEALLDEALRTLSPDEQAGIMARFFEGKDFPEIAETFAITEHAARKRISRCLAKLQGFMQKRRAKVTLEIVSGLLIALPTQEPGSPALQSAMAATHAVWKGKVAVGNAGTLANQAMQSLRWRFLGSIGMKVGLPALVVAIAAWSLFQWHPPVSYRLSKIGKEWGVIDRRIMDHRRYVMGTPQNAPNYNAKVQGQLNDIYGDSKRLMNELKLLMVPPDERQRAEKYFMAEFDSVLKLNRAQKAKLSSYVHEHLAQGATFHDAMYSLGKNTRTEAHEIMAMVTPEQQQLFVLTFGADGVLLFSYAQVTAVGVLGGE